jgi:hypothetical protein
MPATTMRWCPSCQEWFTPDRYNAWHQHYCSKPSCRTASHGASSTDWRRKNPGYFRGEAHCMRVRSWRADHPGYWRRQRRRPAPAATPALQDIAPAEPTAAEGVAPLFPWAPSAPEGLLLSLECPVPSDLPTALQDLALSQHLALTALLQHMRGEPLQDFIGVQLERVYQCGRQRWGVPQNARGPP